MKKLRKIRKNAKALSPVVASIILIAVTVAVSIAVAAWMGALTVGFMGSSSLTISDANFGTPGQITIDVANTGTKAVTVAQAKVNNVNVDFTGDMISSAAGENGTLTLTQTWLAGYPYKIDLYDASGQVIGSYQETSPA